MTQKEQLQKWVDGDPVHNYERGLDTSRHPAWGNLEMISDGLELVDYNTFKNVVLATTGSTEAYAAAMWAEFLRDRIRYCLTRDPIEQGYALVHLACEIAWDKRKEQS